MLPISFPVDEGGSRCAPTLNVNSESVDQEGYPTSERSQKVSSYVSRDIAGPEPMGRPARLSQLPFLVQA